MGSHTRTSVHAWFKARMWPWRHPSSRPHKCRFDRSRLSGGMRSGAAGTGVNLSWSWHLKTPRRGGYRWCVQKRRKNPGSMRRSCQCLQTAEARGREDGCGGRQRRISVSKGGGAAATDHCSLAFLDVGRRSTRVGGVVLLGVWGGRGRTGEGGESKVFFFEKISPLYWFTIMFIGTSLGLCGEPNQICRGVNQSGSRSLARQHWALPTRPSLFAPLGGSGIGHLEMWPISWLSTQISKKELVFYSHKILNPFLKKKLKLIQLAIGPITCSLERSLRKRPSRTWPISWSST